MGEESYQTVLKNKLMLQNSSRTAENYLELSKSNTFFFPTKERTYERIPLGRQGVSDSQLCQETWASHLILLSSVTSYLRYKEYMTFENINKTIVQ